jgi:uncharacterized phage protein gp47/JayE
MPSFTDAGFMSPPELDIYAGAIADLSQAFGGNLNPDMSTPQGQMAMSWSAVIGAFNDLFVEYTNDVDPARSTGRMQDTIARIYFLTRHPATPTVVEATCSGLTGTFLPVGLFARATDGTIYTSLTSGTIPASGSINLQFAAVTNGPIACPPGTLTSIYRSVTGWDSITNATAGEPGQLQESAADLEVRREATVAMNSVGLLPSVRGALLGGNVPGIVDAYVTENNLDTPQTIGGVSLVPHSIYVCVEGGTDADVAHAIWSKKGGGCNYNGNTTVTVEDTNSGYLTPPTYDVTFQRASSLACDYAVSIANGPDVPSDAVAQITAALTGAFPPQARIGQTIYASSSICPIGAIGSWVRIISVTVNGATSQAINIDEFPALGTITVNLI